MEMLGIKFYFHIKVEDMKNASGRLINRLDTVKGKNTELENRATD